jgi:hypothetical protein
VGLFEQAKHVADAQLRATVEPGAACPDGVLRRAILEVDAYRRELARSLVALHDDALRAAVANVTACLASVERSLRLVHVRRQEARS